MSRQVLDATCHAFRLHAPYVLQFGSSEHSLILLWKLDQQTRQFQLASEITYIKSRGPISRYILDIERGQHWHAVDMERNFIALISPEGCDSSFKIEIVRLSDGKSLRTIEVTDYGAKSQWRTFNGLVYGVVTQNSVKEHEAIIVCAAEDDRGIIDIINMPKLDPKRADGENYIRHIPLTLAPDGALITASAPSNTQLLDVFMWYQKEGSNMGAQGHSMRTLADVEEEDIGIEPGPGYSVPCCTVAGNKVLIAATFQTEFGSLESTIFALDLSLQILWKTEVLQVCLVHRLHYLPDQNVVIVIGLSRERPGWSTFVAVFDLDDGSSKGQGRHFIDMEVYGQVVVCTIGLDALGERAVVAILEDGRISVTALDQFLESGFSEDDGRLRLQGQALPNDYSVEDADVIDGIAVMLTVKGWTERTLQAVDWEIV
jgi:hypothetical protein